MTISLTKQVMEMLGAQALEEVAALPDVSEAEHTMSDLLELIFDGNIELMDKVENAVYNYSHLCEQETFAIAFVYGMRAMAEIAQLTGYPNI